VRYSRGLVMPVLALAFLSACDSEDPVAPSVQDPPLEYVIEASDYLNFRFFKLDLPGKEIPGGRVPGDRILEETVHIFQLMPPGEPTSQDILNVAVYVDSLGFRNWDGIDFYDPYLYGRVWREITTWNPYRDDIDQFVAVDLGKQYLARDVLAVVYSVRKADGTESRVGDFPGIDQPEQTLPGGQGEMYYRMKLLKAPVWQEEPHSFDYVLRNIYSLGGNNIDPTGFALRIERNQPGGNHFKQDENGLDYIRIFGLDRGDPHGGRVPDGRVDLWDPNLFDLARGLLKFPLDFPHPFAPGGQIRTEGDEADQIAEAVYSAYADTTAFEWNPSFLRHFQMWEIYDPHVYPFEYPDSSSFRIIVNLPVSDECPP